MTTLSNSSPSNLSSLNQIEPGQFATIHSLACTGTMKRRLLDMGLIQQTVVQCIGCSPNGDPSSYLIRGSVIALRAEDCRCILVYQHPYHKISIALVGNPNVGKSSIFNTLTGLHQHTGNWAGKTVSYAKGTFSTTNHIYEVYDLPGTYSLLAHSAEEEATRDFILTQPLDVIIVVCDATCLERNLNLLLQLLETGIPTIACINLIDEAKKKAIEVNATLLSTLLGIPVFTMSAHEKKDIENFKFFLDQKLPLSDFTIKSVQYPPTVEKCISMIEPIITPHELLNTRFLALQILMININQIPDTLLVHITDNLSKNNLQQIRLDANIFLQKHSISNEILHEIIVTCLVAKSEKLCQEVVHSPPSSILSKDRKLDSLLTSRLVGYPLMLALLGFIFWLTIVGANYPSQLLSNILFNFQNQLTNCFVALHAPNWLHGVLVLGIYRVLAWVVSVMLPPMAIFFPLFTLLEDIGYLPRIAYNLDKPLQKCKACGKQALCMCMGFGCNAVGVIGCRIIDSKRERLLAILTNNFMPCNGRFPTLIAIITMFLIGTSTPVLSSIIAAVLLIAVILVGILATFVSTRILSDTLLKGVPSFFTLELPSYRKPQIGKVIIRSVFDRTITVLLRAVIVSIPAGLIIWLLANVMIADTSLLTHCANLLDPFAQIMGLDGIILIAFILGFPANEIVLPIITMGYLSQGSLIELDSLTQMKSLFVANGWTWQTAICVILFSLMHWPCSTTLITIYKETQSLRWTLVSVFLPTSFGIVSCIIFHYVSSWLF